MLLCGSDNFHDRVQDRINFIFSSIDVGVPSLAHDVKRLVRQQGEADEKLYKLTRPEAGFPEYGNVLVGVLPSRRHGASN